MFYWYQLLLFYLHIFQNFSRNISKGIAYIGQEFDANVNSYKRNYTKYVAPAAPLAYAIPVGGKTQRLHLLKKILIINEIIKTKITKPTLVLRT